MLNVAFLIDTMACDTAGTQKQLLELIRRLDRTRYRPVLVCLWESPWMRTATLPCPVHVLGHTGFLKPEFPGVVRRLGRLLDELDIGLLQIYFDEAIFVGWLGARAARRRPRLLSSRRDMGLGDANQPWYHRLFPLVLPLANRDFEAIVANSEAVRRWAAARERTPLSRYVVIRNGIDVPPPPPRPAGEGRELAVAIVASLTPVKRHDLLLEAWAKLEGGPAAGRARLHLLGEGPTGPALRRQAERLGLGDRVTFTGAVTDVAARLATMDVGVLCSDREGLSNAILEYMVADLPVVATDVGGNPELVDDATGRLVPAGDADALAGALRELVLDEPLRRRLGQAGGRRLRESYSWQRCLAEFGALYDRAAGDVPRAAGSGR